MPRTILAFGVLLLAAGSVCAADPQPLWEVETATAERRVLEVSWVAFAADGKLVVARVEFAGESRADELKAWDAATRAEKFTVKLGQWGTAQPGLKASAVTTVGTVVVPSGDAREVRLADAEVKSVPLGLKVAGATAVWLRPDTRETVWLLGDEYDRRLVIGTLPAFDADPKKAAPGSDWRTVRLDPPKPGHSVRAVTASPDLTRVVVAAEDADSRTSPPSHALGLYTLAAGETPKLAEVAVVTRAHRAPISVIRFSPDGKTLATGGRDCTVCLWDVEKAAKEWKPRATVTVGKFTPTCLAFSPDGRTLMCGTTDRKGDNLFAIDVAGGKLVSSRRLADAVSAVAYSSDGKLLVTGHNLGKVRAWDAAALRGE